MNHRWSVHANHVAVHANHVAYCVELVPPMELVARNHDCHALAQDVGLEHGVELAPMELLVAENGGFVSSAENVGLVHGGEATPMALMAWIDAFPGDGLGLGLVAVVQTVLDWGAVVQSAGHNAVVLAPMNQVVVTGCGDIGLAAVFHMGFQNEGWYRADAW